MDDLSFGPINPPDIKVRSAWVEEELGYTDWETLAPELDTFWSESLADRPRRIVWVSRRCTMEFCGFLEWLRRNGERPCEIVDLTDTVFPDGGDSGGLIPAPWIGLIHDHQFAGARLWDLAKPLTAEARAAWLSLWDQLRSENAPLRVLTPEGLVSAPLSFFDDQILGYVGEEWGKAARVVGYFLYESAYESFSPAGVRQTGDMVPIARLAGLAETGRIEARGDFHELQGCTVRRPRNHLL